MIKSIFSFRTLGYLFFALIVTVALLVARFPGEKIKYSCEKRIEHLFPGSSCNIGEVALTFPPAMTIKNIKVSRGINGQDAVMKVDRLSLIPKPLQFWKSYTVKGQVYAGLLEAELGIDREKATFQLTNIRLEGVQVAGIAESIGLGEREVSGLVEFSGEYRGTLDQPGDGTGKGVLQITNGSLELLQPILALPTLDFNKVTIGVSQEKGKLRIDEGKLSGKDLKTDFAGELQLNSPLQNSRLLLNGQLEPSKEYLRINPKQQQVVQRLLKRYKMTVLPFKVGGTVKRPLFRFSK